jgi:TolB-like protein/Tfp pilus assembly protein PilF
VPFAFESARGAPAPVVHPILPPRAVRGVRQRARVATSALTLLAVVGVGLYVFSGRQEEAAIDSIAVLPFSNVSGDPDTEYLSDGITDSVMNSLSQLRDLRVTARSMVFRYKGKQFDPLQLGRDLQVRAVLTGRVSQRGDTLIVATELMDVANGSQLWGEQYNRQMKDVLVLQEEITREISEKLRLKLTREEEDRLFRRQTDNPEAYQLYLKGRYYFDTRNTAGVKQSTEYFQQAIKTDPNYALAYAGLANSYIPSDTALPPRSTVPLAKAAAAKALETDPRLAEAHIAQARVLQHGDWDWPAAERELKRAIELNPKNPEAHHMYSHYLMPLGRVQEAVSEAKRALELDASDVLINMHLGWAYLFARQYDAAVTQLRKTRDMDPSLATTHEMLGRAYMQLEMYDEAIDSFRKGIALAGGTGENPAAGLSRAYALSGRTDDALKGLTNLKDLYKQGQASAYAVATGYIALGEKDQALEWLDKAYQERGGSLLLLKVDPAFDSLQSDPRFLSLVRHIGLTP